MTTISDKLLRDRTHAAHLLAGKLGNYKNTNAVVIGIGAEGASVGISLAKELNLDFEVVLCRVLKDPAYPQKTMGSVSEGLVILSEGNRSIPQDYVTRQVANLQHEIEKDYQLIYDQPRPSFKYKTVILVGDVLSSTHSLMAGLKLIKNQIPLKMIAAIPVVEPHAAIEIAAEVNDLVFLRMEADNLHEKKIYSNCQPVDLKEIRNSISSLKTMALQAEILVN